MSEAIGEFEALIRDATTSEATMQRFMENHTEFIPTFSQRLHHGVWLNSVFSQLPVGPRKTDFAFLTKHTQKHRVVLIEIEAPGKLLFTSASNYVIASAALNNALDQVRAWRRDLKASPSLLAHLGAVFDSAYEGPPEIKFLLVIGNSDEWVNNSRRSRYLSDIENEDIQVIGYDTILRYLSGHYETVRRPCLLAQHMEGFTIKRMAGAPSHLLETLGPDRLHLSAAHKEIFRNAGYDLERWEQGHLRIRTMRAEPLGVTVEELNLREILESNPDKNS